MINEILGTDRYHSWWGERIFAKQRKDMSIDKLINKALKEIEGPVNTASLWGVVSDVQTKELFVLNVQEFFTNNLVKFAKSIAESKILMGIYSTEEQAYECVETLGDIRVQGPNLIQFPEWHLIMCNPVKNEIFSLSLREYYISCLAFFHYNVDSGNLPVAIFSSADAADAGIDFIRYTIRDENR